MDINELKDKVLALFDQATEGARGVTSRAVGGARTITGTVGDKVKSGGRIAKLSMEAASAREEVKKTYLEIGKLYYDTHRDDPDGFFVQLFEEVRLAEEAIAAKETELADLKESFKEGFPEVSVEITRDDGDFADVVDQAEAEAGAEAEPEAAAEEAAEEVEKAAEEARSTAAEKLENLKDAAAEKFESFKDAAADRFESFKDAAGDKVEAFKDAAAGRIDAFRNRAEDVVEAAEDTAEAAEEAAADAVSEAAEAAEEAAEEVRNEIDDITAPLDSYDA